MRSLYLTLHNSLHNQSWMIERIRNLIIRDYRRRVDILISKNIKETLPKFLFITKKKYITLIELSCPSLCFEYKYWGC